MTLRDQLYGLYTACIYPVLVHNDPVYQRSLAKTGLGLNPTHIPIDKQDSFKQEMKLQAWLAACKIEDARSLDRDTVLTKLLTGPVTLYRISERGTTARPGIWWFTEKVADRCREEAGPDPQKRLDWLRQVLAVCFNWSRFDQVEQLVLRSGETIPAVVGRGLAMPHYKFEPYIDRETGRRVMDKLPPDYWKKKGEWLLGGELQVVLPWIPVLRVTISSSI